MSTYLLAFAVGPFEFVELKTASGMPVRVYAYDYQMEACKFAVGEAIEALKFYEEYFGIEYPLPKCDMISLIGDSLK